MIIKVEIEKILNNNKKYTIDEKSLNNINYLSRKICKEFNTFIAGISEMGIFFTEVLSFQNIRKKESFTIKELFEYFNKYGLIPNEETIEMILIGIITGCLVEYDSKQ